MANDLGITVEDLAGSYEGALEDDVDAIKWYERTIDEAVRMLIGKGPNLMLRVSTGAINQQLVEDIVLRAVKRVLRNVEGFESESEDGYSYKLKNTVASGDLWYPDNDLNLIFPVVAVKRRKAVAHRIDMSGWGAF
jgi:hypothetical protein